MELREVIQRHLSDFTDKVVNPVSLASRLDCLIDYDRDQVLCNSGCRSSGAMKLYDVIIGKVTWPELRAALRKENLTELAKILEEEYYQQHPMARPSPQDENLNSGVDLFEQEPTDSSCDSNTNDSANSNPDINFLAEACFNACTSANINASPLKNTQIVCIQIGNNNCIKIGPYVENDETTAHTEDEEQYQVSVDSCSVSRSLDKNESQENTLSNNSPITVQYRGLPKQPTVPQIVSPQFSSRRSDSQDGGSPKVRCYNETAEHTSQKVVFEEINGSALSDNISFQDNTSIPPESHGHNKISYMSCLEKLGIELRTGVRRCGEGEEKEETELKELV